MDEQKRKRKCVFMLGDSAIYGYFHQWGMQAAELNDGNINWSIAIVEDQDGVIHTPLPECVEFKEWR